MVRGGYCLPDTREARSESRIVGSADGGVFGVEQGILEDGAAAPGLTDDQASGDGVFYAFAGHAAAGELGLGGEPPELGVDVLGNAGGDVN